MKKECEHTRKLLPRYLRGHLFMPQQKRIDRHLASCAVCRSAFDSLRRIDETQRFLKDLDPPDGVSARVRAGASYLAGARKIIFRPLWLVMIAAVAAAAYLYVLDPILHDPDIEKLDAGNASPATAESATRTQPTATVAVPPPPQQKAASAPAAAAPKADPLVITITVEKTNEKAGIRTINDAMKEHALLKTMRFSDKVREISGNLTPDELFTFFNRIQGAGKISYRRARLAAAGSELLPFVMKLQTQAAPPQSSDEKPAARPAPKTAEIPSVRPVIRPEEKPAVKPADLPAEKPANRTEDRSAAPPVSPPAR